MTRLFHFQEQRARIAVNRGAAAFALVIQKETAQLQRSILAKDEKAALQQRLDRTLSNVLAVATLDAGNGDVA